MPGLSHTMTSTPCAHWVVAWATPWRSRSDAPTSDNDTPTVSTAAMVMSRLRHRFDAVSRAT